jgi:hypothetical protein
VIKQAWIGPNGAGCYHFCYHNAPFLANPQKGSGCAPDIIQTHVAPPVAVHGHWINVTSPEVPFTRMGWPVLMRWSPTRFR